MDSNRSTLHASSELVQQFANASATATTYASSFSEQGYHDHSAKVPSAITDTTCQTSLEPHTSDVQTHIDPDASLTEKSDAEEPVVYTIFSPTQKAFIVVTVAVAGLIAPLSSTMYLPAMEVITQEMATTSIMMKLTVALYMVGMGVAPMAWGTLSDTLGRKPVYVASFIIYVGACIGCALSNNIGLLIGMRTIQACGSSSVLAVGSGTICDIYKPKRRGRALGFFFLGALLGPVIGPIVGGYVTQSLGWRWIFWILAILGGVIAAALGVWLPETHRRIVAEKYHANMEDLPEKSTAVMINPLLPLYYMRYIYVAIVIINITLIYGNIYAMATTMPADFARIYNLSTAQVGLTYIAQGVGNVLGSVAGGNFADFMLTRARQQARRSLEDTQPTTERKYESVPKREPHELNLCTRNHRLKAPTASNKTVAPAAAPEVRLTGGVVLVWLMPLCFILYGWLIERNVKLAGVLAVQFLMGIGMTFTFSAFSTYLVDIFTARSATITSLNNSIRSLWGAVCTIIADPMETNLGPGVTFTILAAIQAAFSILIVVLFYKGKGWRRRWPPAVK
ncbi:hypothetical protein H4R34_003864 [Dimargaris verticillata]|uniref:Major facilitator superfamily (MFS) profile domain-containing protein n=1 Tax=Dimargaris verticillata TaxID=2761393 RepID=A0A9W8E8N7_9FUNG|nr:hypothetical protein H4R34_003864 [Dimargaris verticillata]